MVLWETEGKILIILLMGTLAPLYTRIYVNYIMQILGVGYVHSFIQQHPSLHSSRQQMICDALPACDI